MSLRGKTALITGAAGGLGRIIADMYLSRGANIVICDIDPGRLDAAREEYHSSGSDADRVLAVQVDVSDEDSVRSLVDAAVTQFGGLHFVVNNAAVMDRFDPAGALDKALWDRVLAVNLTGPFLVTKHAVAAMATVPAGQDEGNGEGEAGGEGGLIVNICSTASVRGLAAGAAYTASKHGVIGLTKNTAGSYGARGVYAVALVLGGMDGTNISEAFSQGVNEAGLALMQETIPGFRRLPTEHVARYVGFLSEEGVARSANGSCITLNCNWPEA